MFRENKRSILKPSGAPILLFYTRPRNGGGGKDNRLFVIFVSRKRIIQFSLVLFRRENTFALFARELVAGVQIIAHCEIDNMWLAPFWQLNKREGKMYRCVKLVLFRKRVFHGIALCT